MVNPRKQNEIDPTTDQHKRQWHPKDEKEECIIKRFLFLCQEKLTAALIVSISQSSLQKIVDKIYSEKIAFEQLQELDMDEFYDYLTGQRRLFDELQERD